MELSNVNFNAKTNLNDISSKTSAVKDKENSFSKVYKEVNDRTNNDTLQDTTDAAKYTEAPACKDTDASYANKALGENTKADKAKGDTELNNLVQLLLLSQGNNQTLINLLSTGSDANTKEIEDIISKILKDNLGTNNPLNLNQRDNENPFIDEIFNVFLLNGNSKDEGLNKLQGSDNEAIENLAAVIANKLVSDKSLSENIMSGLLVKGEESSITGNDETLKELIINQLKSMSVKAASIPNDKDLSKDNITTTFAFKDEISAAVNNSLNDVSSSISSGSKDNIANNNLIDVSSDKEDKLLKQLTENNGLKDSKDNVSDKIASVLNRFETFKLDNQPLNAAKLTINKATLNEDFIKTVKFMDLNNLKELSVKIIPKDLGEVVIKLSMENGVMKANITAANKDTYNLLNAQLPAINSELAKQNMTIQNFSLSLYNGDNFLFSGDGSSSENSKQQSRNNIKVDNLEEDLQKENYIVDNSTVNLLA